LINTKNEPVLRATVWLAELFTLSYEITFKKTCQLSIEQSLLEPAAAYMG